jgi:hypothetical protein
LLFLKVALLTVFFVPNFVPSCSICSKMANAKNPHLYFSKFRPQTLRMYSALYFGYF